MFNQINAALARKKETFFKNILKILLTPNFWKVVHSYNTKILTEQN